MRRDKDGNLRPLHVEAAMKVASLKPYTPFENDASDPSVIGKCEYFTTRLYKLTGTCVSFKTSDSFIAVSCTRGSGVAGGEPFAAGDSFFMPCGGGRVEFSGECDLVCVSVGDGKIM
jgi:mannose-6-phosphate isomerase